MNRYLLDTGMMGHFINHRRGVDVRVRDARRRGDRIGTCFPVVAELYYGAENSSTRDPNLVRLRRGLSGVVCWPFERDAAEEYGRIATGLRRAGRIIQQVDMMIAAIAVTLGNCTVVTADSDFAAIPGLSIENWAT
jgi:tRNA(fMet)-specific endonuclease VapC